MRVGCFHFHACSPPLSVRRHEGYQNDWSARLRALDRGAGRVWRTGAASAVAGAGAGAAPGGGGGGGFPPEDHKAPEHYYWTYKKRGLFAFGIVRAIRNIAHAHANDYVADGAFASVPDVYDYFVSAFPWLVLEVLQARQAAAVAPPATPPHTVAASPTNFPLHA